jgi:hypothetical protein
MRVLIAAPIGLPFRRARRQPERLVEVAGLVAVVEHGRAAVGDPLIQSARSFSRGSSRTIASRRRRSASASAARSRPADLERHVHVDVPPHWLSVAGRCRVVLDEVCPEHRDGGQREVLRGRVRGRRGRDVVDPAGGGGERGFDALRRWCSQAAHRPLELLRRRPGFGCGGRGRSSGVLGSRTCLANTACRPGTLTAFCPCFGAMYAPRSSAFAPGWLEPTAPTVSVRTRP